MFLALALLAQTAAATPAAAPTPTPDQRIEAAAAEIVDEAGTPYVERIDWSPDTAAPAGAIPQIRVYLASGPWHRTPRSLKREVVDRLARLDWRSSSWAGRSVLLAARVYVGETFLGRIEVRDGFDGRRDDRFLPGRAWADQ